MPILRYTASADTTITNAFTSYNQSSIRATGSNMGASDILEIFSIYARRSGSSGYSSELSRALITFPMNGITTDRASGILPGSGSVKFFLRMYNAKQPFTVPSNVTLRITEVDGTWQEGIGVDMSTYGDVTRNQRGSNWINANGSIANATATLDITNDIILTSVASGRNRNTNTFQLIISPAASNPSDTVLAQFTGSKTAIVLTITPNNGTNNAGNNVTLTTAELVELINNGSVTGKSVTVTDTSSLRVLQTASGGGSESLADNGEGDNKTGTFTGGDGGWKSVGGDYASDFIYTQYLESGLEDINVEVTSLVEHWYAGTKANNGFGIRLSDSDEAFYSSETGANTGSIIHNPSGTKSSNYTKMFFGRGTEFFFKRPVIEAQFEDTTRDDRNKFYYKSPLYVDADNTNKLYFYNRIDNQLKDIANNSAVAPHIKFYYSSGSVPEGSPLTFLDATASSVTVLSAVRESKGVYYANVMFEGNALTPTYPYLVDVWQYNNTTVMTGSAITVKRRRPSHSPVKSEYVLSMPNLRTEYKSNQNIRFRLHVRKKGWDPNIYSVAKQTPENLTIVSGSYRILRAIDDHEIVSYGTGSVKHSYMSYDVSGSYFDVSMNLFEPGYQYYIKYSFYDGYSNSFKEQPYNFKFRVIE